MANFGLFKLTNVGLAVEYKAQGGKQLQFSKFSLGDGTYTGDVTVLTALVNKIIDVDVARLNVQTTDNKKIIVGFNLDNSEITTGFYLREIGLYAKDPDTNEDVLMFYGNAGDTADYIAPGTGSNISETIVDLEINLSNATNITAVIDSTLTLVTKDEFENFKYDVERYAPVPKSVTLNPASWNFNSTTNEYEYTLTDEDISSGNFVIINMDLDNQKKFKQGWVETFNGYLKIYVSSLPTEDIDINLMVFYTTDANIANMTTAEIEELIEAAY